MNYYEFISKATSWEVIDFNDIEVSERKLTTEEIEQWTKTLNDLYSALPLDSSAA